MDSIYFIVGAFNDDTCMIEGYVTGSSGNYNVVKDDSLAIQFIKHGDAAKLAHDLNFRNKQLHIVYIVINRFK